MRFFSKARQSSLIGRLSLFAQRLTALWGQRNLLTLRTTLCLGLLPFSFVVAVPESSAEMADKKKRPKSVEQGSGRSLDLMVMIRHKRTNRIHLLWVSNRAFARRGIVEMQFGELVVQTPPMAEHLIWDTSSSLEPMALEPMAQGPEASLSREQMLARRERDERDEFEARSVIGRGQLFSSIDMSGSKPVASSDTKKSDKGAGSKRHGKSASSTGAAKPEMSTKRTASSILEASLRGEQVRDYVVAASMTQVSQAAWRGEVCGEDCLVRLAPGVVVLGQGIAKGEVEAISSLAKVGRADPQKTLFDLADRIRNHVSGRVPLRSAVYVDLPANTSHVTGTAELLTVDYDPRGRAPIQLRGLHVGHLADVVIPRELLRARRAQAKGDRSAYRKALDVAKKASHEVLGQRSQVARWHGQHALLASLVSPRGNEALMSVEKALDLAPRSPEIRLIAARVLLRRGDVGAASMQLGTVLRLAPDYPAAALLLGELNGSAVKNSN